MKRLVLLLLILAGAWAVSANNVRIINDASVDPQTLKDGYADLKFTMAWDNSWRDDFNWDAVYVFMKYKKTTDVEWKHAIFRDEFHTVSAGYEWWVAKNTPTANSHQGAFIFRNEKRRGDAQVDVTLKWKIGYSATDFEQGNVEMSLMCIEMVYVPLSAFYLGDGVSKNTFKTNYRPILPEWDVIKNDGTQKYTASETVAGYSVEAPANRVNEGRNQTITNAWWSNAGKSAIWKVEFREAKEIRYFGVSGVLGYEGYRPSSWVFEGSVNGVDQWENLSGELDASSWVCGYDSYPVSNAIPVKPDKIKPYRFYRVRVITAANGAMLNNIAMTEKDLDKVNDNGFVVDGQTILMNGMTGLSADDGDTWNSTLNVSYPTGFQGFYAMKYEISQEQYVRFLNKLTAEQQKNRSSSALDGMSIGDYVYGTYRNKANSRNGIIVGSRVNGAVIFSNNLNKSNNYTQDDDGQTLACNFLSVNDMLAYADWAGLRPLSEMEFEKMSRRPYPSSPGLNDWAGGKSSDMALPTAEDFSGTSGKYDEHLIDANINAGGKVSGPVRVGSFAKGATKPSEAGASYWGFMDLSGNLAEIYYNANASGRNFSDNINGYNHGDGALLASAPQGNTNMSTSYWPALPAAFGLRGGSFLSEMAGVSKGETSIADRSKILTIRSLDDRDSTVTFRLGHSCTYLNTVAYNSVIELENGKKSSAGNGQFDSVCVNTSYTIKGTELLDAANNPVNFPGKTNYIWYMSENAGKTWHIIPGENGQNLIYSDWRDQSNAVRPVWIKREVMTPIGMHMTPYVTLNIVNVNYTLNRFVDTVKMSNQAMGFLVNTSLPASFSWRWKSAEPGTPNLDIQNPGALFSYYVPKRSDFQNVAGQNHVVQCEIKILNKCVKREEVKIFVEERREVGIVSSDITLGGANPNKECGVLMSDSRSTENGKVYATVKIGNQCWMAENLRYSGIANSYLTQSGDPDGAKYGFLYTYSPEIANNICPAGWKIPTLDDMTILTNYMAANSGGTSQLGYLLASGNYWRISDPAKVPVNKFGFGAMGTGHNGGSGLFDYTYFASYVPTSPTAGSGYYHTLNISNGAWGYSGGWGSYYFPVRCIKR